MFANIGAGHRRVLLILAIDHFAHPLHQQSAFVIVQQRIPVVPPDDLDDVPAGTAENALQFLDDLAVATDRAIQPLQIAVDHKDQIVQLSREPPA